jgi:hypothetical protein
MPKAIDIAGIVELLVRAAQGREITGCEAWNYGWSDARYRHSPRAAMTHDSGRAVRLDPSAVEYFEQGTAALLKLSQIRRRYDSEEFWGMAASLVGGQPMGASSERLGTAIDRWVRKVLDPPEAFVVFPIANVAPFERIIEIGPMLLGCLDESFSSRLNEKARRDVLAPMPAEPWWMRRDYFGASSPGPPPALLAYATEAQLDRAVEQAGEAFENLTSLALMVQPDLEALSLCSLRGDTHRPGIRGLVVDRKALEEAAQSQERISREIGSPMLVDGVLGRTISFHWYGEHPFPLEQLLTPADKRSVSERLMLGSAAVHNRLRVAARWHAKAHWSIDIDDAVLALGVCFDAMLSEQGPTPGRVLSERFALLHPDRSQRPGRYRQFQTEYYPARSAVAHGAKSRSHESVFVRRMSKDARWVFQRIVQLTEAAGANTESEYHEMYESLKWA